MKYRRLAYCALVLTLAVAGCSTPDTGTSSFAHQSATTSNAKMPPPGTSWTWTVRNGTNHDVTQVTLSAYCMNVILPTRVIAKGTEVVNHIETDGGLFNGCIASPSSFVVEYHTNNNTFHMRMIWSGNNQDLLGREESVESRFESHGSVFYCGKWENHPLGAYKVTVHFYYC